MLCEFLEAPDLSEVVLNSGMDQRLMLVAANFRKEVTSTALWLLSHDIQVQCFKVTPYAMAEELFLNVEQIIPTPEAQELMIGMNAKEAEEKNTEAELKNRHRIRMAFWEQA
ncbi:putative inner membrane protein [Vibrio ishigakensis]|uniref:Putative inner membrane protein n=1 Tax=Vibrio ishigakensis TaxID=1481914 RepID=A0A0B8PG18_9VIBR|nr:putative inner membrane protein [Vibrio ishigakensis]